MKLRTNLIALVLAAMLPIVVFATVAVVLLWRADRRGTEERLRNTARALALAVDREVLSTVTTLEALASAEELDRPDLPAFHAVSRRALTTLRGNGWLTIILTSPTGEPMIDAARPLRPPAGAPTTAAPVNTAISGRAAVSDLLVDSALGRPVVSIRVPVQRQGAPRFALAAIIDPQSFVALLRQQNLPEDWLSSVFDRQGSTIARTVAPERFIGLPAGAHVLEAMKKADEGWLRAVTTRDNRSVYAGYSRAPFAGWTVTFSVPAETVDAKLQRSLVTVVGGGALLTVLGIVLAGALARRLAAPMGALARYADAVGRGEAPPPEAGAAVDEVREVGEALARAANDRRRTEAALRQESAVLDAVNRAGRSLSEALDLQKVVQAVTDAATAVSGAAFGAFFYNVTDGQGESFMLYAISGVPREKFATFPMPRNTELFGPTFRGEGPIRLDDVTKDPRFGKNPPHHGMPAGHLPVASYLAVPVVSRSGEVIGGLFFGHPEPARFGAREEQVVVGLAAQAAVAVDNARLYEKEQQARLDAEAANRTKDEFLATLSHELRTPLNAILGWARMLEAGELAPAVRDKALGVIVRNAKMQSQLIEDLLDVSRIVSGKLKLETRPMALAPVVEAAIDTIRPGAAAKDIGVQTAIDAAGGTVLGDPGRLQQVVWNLLSNAVKFTPPGGRVHVSLQSVAGHAEIIVADTGRGIPDALLPVIFDRFRQADSSSRRAHGGLGIGLALVRHLAEMHGGTVSVDSAGDSQGATFTVKLPLLNEGQPDRDGVEPAARTGAAIQRAPGGMLEGLTVLVVDDERDALELFATILAGAGAETRAALSTHEALRILDDWLPDVVVSDIEMPGEDGYALIRRLRARGDAAVSLPAVAVTAYGRIEDRVRALEAGFQMHIVKPVEPTELVAVIASLARRATR
jgi:signal transduction histidine kinase